VWRTNLETRPVAQNDLVTLQHWLAEEGSDDQTVVWLKDLTTPTGR